MTRITRMTTIDVRKLFQHMERIVESTCDLDGPAHDVIGPPGDSSEHFRGFPAHSDQVIAPVTRRSHHKPGGVLAQQVKGPPQKVGGYPRAIRADHDDRRGAFAQGFSDRAGHALPEVSLPLGPIRKVVSEALANRSIAPADEPDLHADPAARP